MIIGVIGAGYVGLVAATCFASFGMRVICVDKDPKKVESLNQNQVPIYEPGLEELLKKVTKNGSLTFTTDLNELAQSQVVILAVGTPSKDNGDADLSYLFAAVDEICNVVKHKVALIIKSTVPIGTANTIREKLEEKGVRDLFNVISNPEFLREGSAVYDFMHPDRIVVGVGSQQARKIAEKLYHSLTSKSVPLLITDNATAETIKYASNSYLAMRVAYINEVSDLCEAVGANVTDVAHGMGLDARIGRHYLSPGPGYGGSCFPKDTKAICYKAEQRGVNFSIIDAVIKSNDERKINLAKRIAKIFKAKNCKKIAVLGVVFKADTDDMRDSSSLVIVPYLRDQGFELKIYDPSHSKQAEEQLECKLEHTAAAALANADAALVLTEWSEFRTITSDKLASTLRNNVVCDLRNLYDPEDMAASGIEYYSIGHRFDA